MRYLYWFFVLLTVFLRRILFIFVFVAIPFRKYLRNAVYNWHIQNDVKLKRLFERTPTPVDGGYSLKGWHTKDVGFIKKRNVSNIEYYLILPLWLVLDDDCNEDTYDATYNKTIVKKERLDWLPASLTKKLETAYLKSLDCKIKGNAFDLGDRRSECPLFEFWSTLLWSIRNPAYNFNYKFNQLTNPDLAFKFVFFNRIFGWELEPTDNTYSWECGKEIK